jgi:Zn-dependent protease
MPSLDIGKDFLFRAIAFMVPMILSLSIHEYAHARVAWALGDDTASRMGRLTLNPLSHIDVVGTLIIPLVAAAFGGLPLIGWAKPVPVTPVRFTRRISMRLGMAIVAAAGPLSNLLLALALLVAYRFAFPGEPLNSNPAGGGTAGVISYMMTMMVYLNLGLMIFNFLPIPPLDGSRLLPRSLDGLQERIRPYSYIILMLVLVVLGGVIFMPVWILLFVVQLVLGIPGG